jgi:hypothetical protein
MASNLTGRFNFRRTLTGKLVMRVEEDTPSPWPWSRGARRKRWRDAGSMDLAAPELRALVDLRTKPQYPTHRYFELAGPGSTPLPEEVRLAGELGSDRPVPNGQNSWQIQKSSQ